MKKYYMLGYALLLIIPTTTHAIEEVLVVGTPPPKPPSQVEVDMGIGSSALPYDMGAAGSGYEGKAAYEFKNPGKLRVSL